MASRLWHLDIINLGLATGCPMVTGNPEDRRPCCTQWRTLPTIPPPWRLVRGSHHCTVCHQVWFCSGIFHVLGRRLPTWSTLAMTETKWIIGRWLWQVTIITKGQSNVTKPLPHSPSIPPDFQQTSGRKGPTGRPLKLFMSSRIWQMDLGASMTREMPRKNGGTTLDPCSSSRWLQPPRKPIVDG